jgi:hypothetical protein
LSAYSPTLVSARAIALHQELVGQNQHDEKHHRGHRAYKKCPELLKDFLHDGSAYSACLLSSFFSLLGRLVWSLPRGVNIFFVTGAERQVNETGPDFGIPVMAVTFGNESPK